MTGAIKGWAGRIGPAGWLGVLWLACPVVLHGHADKVHGDGIGYFVYARALVLHGDFRLREGDRVPTEPRSVYAQSRYLDWADAHGGWVRTQYPAGPALLWAPAVSLTHAALRGLRAAGIPGLPPADGYSMPYRVAACWATLLAGLAGVLAAFALARRLTSPGLAALAVAGTWFATPLFYYMSFEASMSEVPGFAAVTCAFLAWARAAERRKPGDWLIWGAAAGLATIMRLPHGFLLAGPLVEWLRRDRRPPIRHLAWFAAGAAPLLLAQAAIWRASTGAWTPPPYTTGIEEWTKFWPWPMLFSSRHGLLSSHPIWWAGLAGFMLWLRTRPPRWAWGAAAFLGWTAWLNQLPVDFWAGHSFGARRFVPVAIVCMLGIAWLLERARRRSVSIIVLAIPLALLVAHSMAWIRAYRADASERDQPRRQVPAGIGIIDRMYRATGWPFSWPANLAWAAVNGTTPDRYDLGSARFVDIPGDLVGTRAGPEPCVDFREPRARDVLGDGWTIVPGRGVVPPPGGGEIWINRCRQAVPSGVVVSVQIRGRSGRVSIRLDGRTVVESEKVGSSRSTIVWHSPAADWGYGTHRLQVRAEGFESDGFAVESIHWAELMKTKWDREEVRSFL